MKIQCKNWEKGGIIGGGVCSLGLFGGRPSLGTCVLRCEHCDNKKEEINYYLIERNIINKLFIDDTDLDTETTLLNYKKYHDVNDIKEVLLDFAKEGKNIELLKKIAIKLGIK